MAFSDKNFKTIGDVLLLYPINYTQAKRFEKVILMKVSDTFNDSIQLTLDNVDYKASEQVICEALLYPVLVEAWKPYIPYFAFWSHKALVYDDFLKSLPDFLFSKRSAKGKVVFEQPYIAVVEAKLDDFSGGWAQCALEMIAIQKINNEAQKTIFGIVSNGDRWEFGTLKNDIFTQYQEAGDINDLPKLLGILTYILEECKRIYIDGEN